MDVLNVNIGRKFEVHCKAVNSKPLPQKRPRLKLNPKDYKVVRNWVLERDGWRCQECGSMKGLQVHHMKRRGQLGGDEVGNLITLCNGCHGRCHGRGPTRS